MDSLPPPKLTEIPPLMLRIILLAWLVWSIVIPLAFGLRTGRGEWVQFAICATAAIPAGIFILWLSRVLQYLGVLIYWYLAGFSAVLSLCFASGVIVALVTDVRMSPIPGDLPQRLPLPEFVLSPVFTIAAVVVLLIVVIVFFRPAITWTLKKLGLL